MSAEVRSGSLEKAEAIRAEFKDLLSRTNKDHPRAEDVKALSDLLNGNKSLELWRDVLSAAQYAERAVIENSPGVHGVKECWRLRLASLRNELGYVGAPILEQLLIQDAALSWLKLSIVELQYSHVMKQSITLTLGIFWEKRLSAAQRRSRVLVKPSLAFANSHATRQRCSSISRQVEGSK